MSKIAIIIPSRLEAERLPNKPLKKINNKEMILHVYELARNSGVGEVFVASPNDEILKCIKNNGGEAVKTSDKHKNGTYRVFEVFSNKLKSEADYIINLQGDMPNLDKSALEILAKHMTEKRPDVTTLASDLKKDEAKDPNIVKVITEKDINKDKFSKAKDFFRVNPAKNEQYIYHHVGIYGFTNKALIRYVSLDQSKLEVERKLEQLRALENKMTIDVGYINSSPLSVDTEIDLIEIKKKMENK